MGLLDAFKKKKPNLEEEFSRLSSFPSAGEEQMPGGEFKTDIGKEAESITPISLREPESLDRGFGRPQAPLQRAPVDYDRELELLSSKLDAVKAQLDTLNEKMNTVMRNMERKRQW